jgi:pimeloyl-ACP methyl ester carboxylesterase
MIALHGGGGDRWQFVNENFKEALAIRDVASKYEMIYVCPECRGKSCTWMGPAAEADLAQIIKTVHRRYRINKVFVTGQSSGATSALTFAAIHPELVDGVAVLNGIANFFEYQLYQEPISKSFGGSKGQVPLEYKKRSAEYWPERLTMPVAFTTSGKDEAMPPQSATRLAIVLQQIAHPVLLIHRPDAGHSTSYEDSITALEYVVSGALKKPLIP